MKPTFIPNEDLDDRPEYHGYYGKLYDHPIPIKTPYFKEKLDCEKYTREFCEANGSKYSYNRVYYKLGRWSE